MKNKTLATAITSIIVFILLVIKMITGIDFAVSEDVLTSLGVLIAAGIMWAISNYWNQDYSTVAKKITPLMRQIKELEKVGDLRLLDKIQHVIDEWDGEEYDD